MGAIAEILPPTGAIFTNTCMFALSSSHLFSFLLVKIRGSLIVQFHGTSRAFTVLGRRWTCKAEVINGQICPFT